MTSSERSLDQCARSVRGTLWNPRQPPCGVLTHTHAAPDGQSAIWGFSGDTAIAGYRSDNIPNIHNCLAWFEDMDQIAE